MLILAETPKLPPIEFPISPLSIALAFGAAGIIIVAGSLLPTLVRIARKPRQRRA